MLAETHWADGTRDDINVETLQPPEWIKQHDVRIGATVPLPLDLVEMGLPRDLAATVIAIERCPEINDGAGRVVLTTINHLNRFVFELTIKDGTGHSETVRTTGFHKFYSASRSDWISAAELRKGEQLKGVSGALTVAALASLPGVHRVYNMTVEDEHVYRVGGLGTLVHNAGCTPRSTLPRAENGDYLPNPEATGPHTNLGTRVRPTGPEAPYPQGSTFDGNGVFQGRTDVTDHGLPDTHPNPHFHPATGGNSVGPAQPIGGLGQE